MPGRKRKRGGGAAEAELRDRKPARTFEKIEEAASQACRVLWLEGLTGVQPISVLEREYKFGKTLAAGGFGEVHVLFNREQSRNYACKVVPKRFPGPGQTLVQHERYKAQLRKVWKCSPRLCTVELDYLTEF